MDFKSLKYFVAVYEAKGFARAAIALNTVQSNVSARIRKLEDFLGVTLFVRLHRSIVSTKAGEKLYDHAKRVITLVEEVPGVVKGERVA